MTKLYLITGFLGAGKTTFLKNVLRQTGNRKTALIVNEFGRIGVDGTLLREMQTVMTEICGGSVFCACRVEQFTAAVRQLLQGEAPEQIFVEASGLADPTAIESILRQEEFPDLQYAGAVCLADGARFHKVYQSARVCRMQLAAADLVVINKTDLASPQEIDAIRAVCLAQKPERPVHAVQFGAFDPAWFSELACCHAAGGADGAIHGLDVSLQRLSVRVSGMNEAELRAFLKLFADDTYRVKGFVRLDGAVHLVDCVGPMVCVAPFEENVENCGELVVLYGHGLPAKKSLRAAMEQFPAADLAILS